MRAVIASPPLRVPAVRRPRPALACVLAGGALLALPAPAAAWGFAGHRMANRFAASAVPAPLRAFYEGNAAWLAEHSIDPDLRRDRADDPDHFVDMDAFGAYPFPDILMVEADHYARFGADAREKGRLPWRVGEVYRGLVAAFRAGDEARVLQHSADLGHLIADAHVPLHAALNHDGQLTGQHGLHSRWESALVERLRFQLEPALQPAAARRVADPVAHTFAVLRESFLNVAPLLLSDQESAGPADFADTPEDDRYDNEYYSRMAEREKGRVLSRLAASATSAASLWLSAWEDAGRPALDAAFRLPYVRGQVRGALLSLDGAASHVIDDAVARGLMPRLAALRARGATARGAISALSTKTAPGHAALYTGAWSETNAVVGNEVPVPGGSVLDVQSGYSSTAQAAEPLWFTAARQDVAATVVSATQVYPFSAYGEERRFRGYAGQRLVLFDGYQNLETDDAVLRGKDLAWTTPASLIGDLPAHVGAVRMAAIAVAGSTVDVVAFDDPKDPVAGFDTLLLTTDGDLRSGVKVKASPPRGDGEAFAALPLQLGSGESVLFFRLFALSADGSDLMLYRSPAHVLRSNRSRVESAALEATGGFLGNGAGWAYEQGELGPKLDDGGDGTAEERYLETVALVLRQGAKLNDFAIARTDWSVLFTYSPFPDEALHRWYGHIDPSLPGHDPRLGARYRGYLDRVLRMVDAYVGGLVDRLGPEVVLAVATDHGMTSSARSIKPNAVLREAGLLAVDESGGVDLTRTRAMYFAGNSGFVLINRASRPSVMVNAAEEDEVRRQVTAALRALVDPATRRPVILDVLDTRTRTTPAGKPPGDLFLIAAPGYAFSARTTGEAIEPVSPGGTHFQHPEHPQLLGAFAVTGPGVARGVDLGIIRQIDIAPTLAALLGLDPPAHATGAVLPRALAHPLVPARTAPAPSAAPGR